MIVVFDKHVVAAIVNIGSADLIPIAKATRNAEDGIAKIGNQAFPKAKNHVIKMDLAKYT